MCLPGQNAPHNHVFSHQKHTYVDSPYEELFVCKKSPHIYYTYRFRKSDWSLSPPSALSKQILVESMLHKGCLLLSFLDLVRFFKCRLRVRDGKYLCCVLLFLVRLHLAHGMKALNSLKKLSFEFIAYQRRISVSFPFHTTRTHVS